MYKDILNQIDHVAIWPVVSFIIFFLFFLGLLWWVFAVDKIFIEKMGKLPLEDESTVQKNGGSKN